MSWGLTPTAAAYTGVARDVLGDKIADDVLGMDPGGAAGTVTLLASSGDAATLVSDGTNWLMTQYIPNNILLLE